MGVNDRIIRNIALKYNLELDEVEKVVRSQFLAAKHVIENRGVIHLRYLGKVKFDERIQKHIEKSKLKRKIKEEENDV